MIDPEFIERCMSPEFQKYVDEWHKEYIFRSNKWQRENPELQNECNRRYSKTEKGKVARKKTLAIYHKRIRELSKRLDDQEKEAIRLFYVNCPEGYHVDHIIPLSKGGLHHINNLQYLTAKENLSKGNRIYPERDKIFCEYQKDLKCVYCGNEMIELSDETIYCEDCKKAFKIRYQPNPPL